MLEKLMKHRDDAIRNLQALMDKVSAEGRLFSDAEEQEIAAHKATIAKAESQIDSLKDVNFDKLATKSVDHVTTASVVRAGGAEAKKEFESLDEFIKVAMTSPNDQRLEYKAAQEMGTGSSGGFAVPKQFLNEIKSFEDEDVLVRPDAMVIPAGTPPDSEIDVPALNQGADGASSLQGGVSVQWLNEGGDKPQTQFKLRQISLKPHEVAAIIPFTDKLLRNMSAASALGAQLLRRAIAVTEDYAFMTGDGIGKPKGIIDSSGAYTVNRNEANKIKLVDLKNMFLRFKGNLAKAKWVCDRLAFEQLLSMTGDGGGATNVISVNQTTGDVKIYGIPVKMVDIVGTLGTPGDIGLYDFSKYYIKDGSGPILEAGHDTGDFKANRTSIKMTWNVDGKPMLDAPLKTQANVSVSPFVILGNVAA